MASPLASLFPSLPITSDGPLPSAHKATITPWENWIMTAHNKVKETVAQTGKSLFPAKLIHSLCTRHWLNMDVDTEYWSWYIDPHPVFPTSVPLITPLPQSPRSTSMPPSWSSPSRGPPTPSLDAICPSSDSPQNFLCTVSRLLQAPVFFLGRTRLVNRQSEWFRVLPKQNQNRKVQLWWVFQGKI